MMRRKRNGKREGNDQKGKCVRLVSRLSIERQLHQCTVGRCTSYEAALRTDALEIELVAEGEIIIVVVVVAVVIGGRSSNYGRSNCGGSRCRCRCCAGGDGGDRDRVVNRLSGRAPNRNNNTGCRNGGDRNVLCGAKNL